MLLHDIHSTWLSSTHPSSCFQDYSLLERSKGFSTESRRSDNVAEHKSVSRRPYWLTWFGKMHRAASAFKMSARRLWKTLQTSMRSECSLSCWNWLQTISMPSLFCCFPTPNAIAPSSLSDPSTTSRESRASHYHIITACFTLVDSTFQLAINPSESGIWACKLNNTPPAIS